MKVAVSPEIAVKFGSAKVLITPARSMARKVVVDAGKLARQKGVGRGPPLAEKGLVVLKFTTAVP